MTTKTNVISIEKAKNAKRKEKANFSLYAEYQNQLLSLPYGLQAPPHCIIGKNFTLIMKDRTTHRIDAGIYIKSIITDLQSNQLYWNLVFVRNGKIESYIMDRAQAQSATRIQALSGVGFPVHSGNARLIVEFLAQFEAHNYDRLLKKQQFTSQKMGWHKDGGFLLGKHYYTRGTEQVTFHPGDAVLQDLERAYITQGTVNGWMSILQPAMQQSLHAQMAFYSAFVPPLLKILQCDNFMVDFAQRTSRGKTTILRIAASCVGVPQEDKENSAMITWEATRSFIERYMDTINELPLIIDDTKRAKSPRDIDHLIYTATQGKGNGTSSFTGIRSTKNWRTVLISSGEQPATSYTNDGGARARVLTITGSPFPDGSATLVNTIISGLREHYGHGYAVFIPWLVNHRDAFQTQWHNEYQEWLAYFSNQSDDNVSHRLAQNMAAIYTAATLVHRAFEEVGIPLPWTRGHLEKLWDGIKQEAADELGDSKALEDTLAWVVSNPGKFPNKNEIGQPSTTEVFGAWYQTNHTEYLVIREQKLNEILKKWGYNPYEVLVSWRDQGYLDIPNSRKGFSTNVRFGNHVIGGYVKFKYSVLPIEK